jgi:hypothetical protein
MNKSGFWTIAKFAYFWYTEEKQASSKILVTRQKTYDTR